MVRSGLSGVRIRRSLILLFSSYVTLSLFKFIISNRCKKKFEIGHKTVFELCQHDYMLSKTGVETLYTIFQIKKKCKIRDFKEKS